MLFFMLFGGLCSDSTNQVAAYFAYAKQDSRLSRLLCGVVNRQIRYVLHDAYANAFNYDREGGPWQTDIRKPPMTAELHEGKYELDSLAAVLKMFNNYVNANLDFACIKSNWPEGMQELINTVRAQQVASQDEWDNPAYTFRRFTTTATDTLMMGGRGPPANSCGLSKCPFRPSDDATTLPHLVPANAMVAVELERFAAILRARNIQQSLADQAAALGAEIRNAVDTYGIVNDAVHGRIYAYEVDCFSSTYIMDDANVPSVLALPYLGYTSRTDPVYLRSREVVLSSANPYYFSGTAARGIGGRRENAKKMAKP